MMQVFGNDRLLAVGENLHVLDGETQVYEAYKDQPMELVEDLRGLTIDEQCRSIFAYLVEHVRYRLDPDGVQYIKTPARLLSDGEGDCKSLAMFICCCLHCLGITNIFRFVNFDGGRQYSHVYAVAIDENGREIILDPCELDNNGVPVYDYARPYQKKKDFVHYE